MVSKENIKRKSISGKNNNIPSYLLKYIRGSETLPPPLSKEEEQKYIQRLSNGSLQAKQTLIEHNLRLVVYISKRFKKANMDIEDIISVGTIGLIKAINTYKFEKNIKLATYTSRCIQNEILMYFRKANKNIEVSFEELLNSSDDESRIIEDVLGTDSDIVERAIDSEIDKELLYKAIKKLTVKEQEIIILRFGLNGFKEHTQKEVSKKMSISQSYISKLEQRIYSRLKDVMVS